MRGYATEFGVLLNIVGVFELFGQEVCIYSIAACMVEGAALFAIIVALLAILIK